jgi:multiple sugar transport system substrate-binding protein
MADRLWSRRQFLRSAALAGSALLAACQPKVVEVTRVVEKEVEKVVKETVVEKEVVEVEKEVTRVVKEQVEIQVEAKESLLPWKYEPLGTPNDGEPITISYWDWHTPRVEMMQRWFPKYSQVYPNVDFEVSQVPFSDYWTKLKAAIPAGEAPDCVYFHQGYGNFETFVWGGLLEPFPEELFPPTAMKETFTSLPAWLGPGGRIYWIPSGAMSGGIFYNKDMFEEAGLTGDDIPVTWAELREFAKELTTYDSAGRVDVSGFDINGYEMSTYGFIWRNQGTWLWDEGYNYPCYAQQPIIDALQWMVDIKEQDKIVDPDFLGWMDAFGSEKAYMVFGWSWFSGWLNVNQPQVNYGVRRTPTLSGEFSPCAGGGSADPQSIVVPVTGEPERKMAAFDLIAWLYSNPEFLIDNSLTLGSPPTTPQIADHPLLMGNETVQALTPQSEWLIFGGGGAPTSGDIINKWLRDGIYGTGMDVKEAIFACQEELNRATDEFRESVGIENFRVFERQYIHADLMEFPDCLM